MDREAARLAGKGKDVTDDLITRLRAIAQRIKTGTTRHRDEDAVMGAADEIGRLRAAAQQARAALSDLIATRDPIVYSDALRALDEALKETP